MKYLLLGIALFIQPETNEKTLGTLLAMEADCTEVEAVDMDNAWNCSDYLSYSLFQMYVSIFIDKYSDVEQSSAWSKLPAGGYAVTVSYDDGLYSILYASQVTAFTIIKLEQ